MIGVLFVVERWGHGAFLLVDNNKRGTVVDDKFRWKQTKLELFFCRTRALSHVSGTRELVDSAQ